MVKPVEEAVKEVVEGKKQNIAITYFEGAFIDVYDDIAGYQVNGDWVAVMTKDGTTHVIPSSRIQYIRHYTV